MKGQQREGAVSVDNGQALCRVGYGYGYGYGNIFWCCFVVAKGARMTFQYERLKLLDPTPKAAFALQFTFHFSHATKKTKRAHPIIS